MAGTKSIDKALSILKYLLNEEGRVDVEGLSAELGIPLATAYRHIAALERNELLRRDGRSGFSPGLFLLRRFDRQQFHQILAKSARPLVAELSRKFGLTAHLGVFEDDMVTYLVKSELDQESVFTRETTQLDAYCSSLGKVLLAGLPSEELDNYLAGGVLPRITAETITNEKGLRRDIKRVAHRGYAIDNAEFEEGLYCIAVPVIDRDPNVVAALSLSSHSSGHIGERRRRVVFELQQASKQITETIYCRDPNAQPAA